MPQFLKRGLALLPWGWLCALVFNLVVLFVYLALRPAPPFLELLLLLFLQLLLLVAVTLHFLATLARTERQKQELQIQSETRRRIFSELHDEMGSSLLSIAHAGRSTRAGGLASAALKTLRDAVARANSDDIGIGEFLSALHEEMHLRLGGLGIALEWTQPACFNEWTLSRDQHYRLARIFRELVSNIIRHASASRVDFEAAVAAGGWRFRMADDGVGFDETQAGGNGMAAIREWAAALNAAAKWETRPGRGLLFTLILPYAAQAGDAKSIP